MPGSAEARRPDHSAPPPHLLSRFGLVLNLSLAAILCLIGYLIWSGYQSSQAGALSDSRNLAGILSENIESALDRAQSDLRVFERQISAGDLSGQVSEARLIDLETRMGAHLRSFPAVINYRVFNAVGQSVFGAGAGDPNAKIDVAERIWFQQLRDEPDRDLVLSRVVIGKATHDQTIILAVPLRDGERRLQGALVAAVNLAHFQKLIDGLDIGESGLVAVRRIDDLSLVLRRPAQAGLLNAAVTQGGLSNVLRSGQPSGEGDFLSGVDNMRRSYAFRNLRGYPLTVIVAIAAEDYLAAWRTQASLAGVLGLGLIAVVVVVHRREQVVGDQLGQAVLALQNSESRLANEADRFRQLLRTASDGIHILDTQGNLVLASDSFYAMLGYDANDPPNLRVADWDIRWTPDELVERLTQLIATPNTFYTKHRRRDGTVLDVEINSRGVHLDDREFLFASSRDVTERNRAEAASRTAQAELQATLARLNLVLKTVAEGIIGIDDEQRVMFVTPAAATILGWPKPDELVGRSLHDVTGHVLADGSSCLGRDCHIRNAVLGGDAVRIMAESFTRADGAVIPVEYVVSTLFVSGHAVGAVFVFHDITERRAMELGA